MMKNTAHKLEETRRQRGLFSSWFAPKPANVPQVKKAKPKDAYCADRATD